MANKPTQPVFPLGLVAEEQSTLAGILNTGTIEHGPDAVLTLPEGNASAGLPSSVRYNADSDEFEGFYENGGWMPLGGGGIRWEALPHASTATLTEGRGYLVDNSTGVSTVVFPSPTRIGDSVTVCDLYGKFSLYPLTIDPNGRPMYGSVEPMTLSTDSVSATFTWSGDARGWIVTAGVGLGQGRVYSRTIFTETVASDTAQVTLTTQPSIVDVYVDGKRLLESKYSLNGFNVDFSPSIPSGSELQVIQYVPIQLGNGSGGAGGGTVITWIYNSGSAVGGETEIELDVDAEDVSEIFIDGSRQQKGLGFTYDSVTKIITLADELEAGDEVVVVINGDPTLYNQIDRTPNEVARATNVPLSQVIMTSDTVTKLGGKTIIYDVVAQKIWGLPAGIPTGASIVSVSGSTLTYAPGDVVVTLIPYLGSADHLSSLLGSSVGINYIGGGVHAGQEMDTEAFETIIISGEVYVLDTSVTGLSEGFSVQSSHLYLTYNSNSYKLLPNGGKLRWPGVYTTGLADAKESIEAIMEFGLDVDLNGYAVPVSSLNIVKKLFNGEVVALGDTGSFVTVNSTTLRDVKVNCNNKAIRRAVHLKTGSSRPRVVSVEVFDSTGATNANGIFVDANGITDFLVYDVTIRNLTSVANGSQGDADGPCRGIIVGTALDPAPTQSTVSSGLIKSIRVRELAPFEDCDGVVVQIYDSTSTMLSAKNIRVEDIDCYNVRKRAVKIQANDVSVKIVNAVCDTTDTAMYSIVSLYGENGWAESITGRGRISNGVDCAYGLNHVSNLFLNTERTGSDTLAGIGAGLLINSGQVNATNIWSEGAEYVVAIRDALGNVPYAHINGIYGQGYSGGIRFQQRAGNTIGVVHLSDISLSSPATNKGAISLDITSGVISLITISGVKRINQASTTSADIQFGGNVTKAIIRDAVLNQGSSSVGIVMTTGTLVASEISSNKVNAIQINQTVNSKIDNVDGVVRITDSTGVKIGSVTSIVEAGTNAIMRIVYV